MPFLLTYAIALNVIPLVRWIINKRANGEIERRNGFRRQWADRLRSGGEVVQRKLKAAKAMSRSLK